MVLNQLNHNFQIVKTLTIVFHHGNHGIEKSKIELKIPNDEYDGL